MSNKGFMVRPRNTLNADEKKLFSRLMEVCAGFSEYTDAQVGRIIDYLEKSGQLENTLIFYGADNGASGEGSPNGSVNENTFFNGYPLSGVSMRYSFDAKPNGKTRKKRQYYTMLGTRGIWENGWKAAAIHAPLTGKRLFAAVDARVGRKYTGKLDKFSRWHTAEDACDFWAEQLHERLLEKSGRSKDRR